MTYPSTDDHQWVRLTSPIPTLNVISTAGFGWSSGPGHPPHYVVLFFLYLGAIVVVIGAWFAILFTGRYPRGIFDYVEGVIRWHNRAVGYARILVTDRYPPFALSESGTRPRAPEAPL